MQLTSLKELLDSASIEDCELIVENFLRRLNGESVAPILNRTTFKISNIGTDEEIRQRIAEQMGIPVDLVPPLNTEVELEKQKQTTSAIQEITTPYLAMLDANPKSGVDKRKEALDLGRFIQSSGLDIKIIVPENPLSYPDFLISVEGETVGLEHTRLIRPDIIARIQSARLYVEKATELVNKKMPNTFGTVSVFIDFDQHVIGTHNFKNTKFTIAEKKQIPVIIADYIEATLKGDIIEKPAFIADVRISENSESRLDILLSENYFAKQGFKELLFARVSVKEKKIGSYLSNIGTDRCWLLIVVDGFNSHSSFDLKYEIFELTEPSKFELIILLDTFSGEIFIVYDQTRSIDITTV